MRGAGGSKVLFSNRTTAEGGGAGEEGTNYGAITSFDSSGFTVAPGAVNSVWVNQSSDAYVAWCFDAGTTTTTNTAGSITSQVRTNGYLSIVTYTGTRTSNGTDTIGHGLGVAPELVLIKRRDGAADWHVKHKSLTSWQYALTLNSTVAQYQVNTTYGTMSAPTSTVFSTSYTTDQNVSGYTYVAYCFAPVAGYSSFGSYVGNGSSDGVFVYTGHRPRWILLKATSIANESWIIIDTARSTYNVVDAFLRADTSGAEFSSSLRYVDILSNGFKLRASGTEVNGSGTTYIYASFAESPFAYSRAR